MLRYLCLCVGLLCAATPALAQSNADLLPTSVLVIDADLLFAGTEYGQRIEGELEANAAAIQAENERLVAEILAEEKALTDARLTMEDEAFRAASAAFDTKAQELRRSRDAVREELLSLRAQERTRFLDRVRPIIVALMVERGASVVLDRRSTFLTLSPADVTDAAISLIDEVLGDGTRDPAEGPQLRPSVDTEPTEALPNDAPDN